MVNVAGLALYSGSFIIETEVSSGKSDKICGRAAS